MADREKEKSIRNQLLPWMVAVVFLAAVIWFSVPPDLFNDPCSTVITDREGLLLGARIAPDGQWRFPVGDEVPEKYVKALLEYEDRWFRFHPGVNPVSLIRAAYHNIREGRIVSGGSTLTMQVARMAGKGRPRTLLNKAREILLALRIEWNYTKQDILALYANNAPFGGNVVGIQAASWRYFGKAPSALTWSEAATLAVLPNAPARIHPGRKRDILLERRNHLLIRLSDNGWIDRETALLACTEPLASRPLPLPALAPWLLDRACNLFPGQRVKTTINLFMQEQAVRMAENAHRSLALNQIWNIAVLIGDVRNGEVLAYVGNTPGLTQPGQGAAVDIIRSPRSTGSILKPFLFEAMIGEGSILAGTLIPDIPMQSGGFSPKNYLQSYDGAVPAKRALERSLNIPAVKMLQQYGVEKFWKRMKSLGMTTLRFPSGHYGLSLILGGAEGSLWDICGMYAGMAAFLNRMNGKSSPEFSAPFRLVWTPNEKQRRNRSAHGMPLFSGASVWITLESLTEVNRPDEESGWRAYNNAGKIAWKTGTSFGFRDGWAIGLNPRYVVGVWTGNATGMGRPGLTGSGCAAPVMFNLFSMLDHSAWFRMPRQEMVQATICRYSGHRAGEYCEPADTVWIQKPGLRSQVCPYHQLISMDPDGKFRVTAECCPPGEIRYVKWFVLPPAQEWYYRIKNPFYRILPPWKPGCGGVEGSSVMELVYPRNIRQIGVPVELDGSPGRVVFVMAHRNPAATLFWHLDDHYLAATTGNHQLSIHPSPGKHTLTVVDNSGNRFVRSFAVKDEKK